MSKGKILIAILAVALVFGVVSFIDLFRKSEPNQTKQEPGNTAVAAEPEKTLEVHSGDGKAKLLGTNKRLADATTNYVFRVVNEEDSPRKLFSKTLSLGGTIEVPANSWSPDNKQLFVQENNNGVTNYLVYKADGSKYKNGDDHLDVSAFWEKSKYKYTIKTATGWAGNDLLELLTTKEDGTAGPSFWFVTSSRNFLQLRSI